MHEGHVQPHGDGGAGQPGSDVVFAADEETVPIALDLPVNFDGLPGDEHRGAVAPPDRGRGWREPRGLGAAHGQGRWASRSAGCRLGVPPTVAIDGYNSLHIPDTDRNRWWIGEIRHRIDLADAYAVLIRSRRQRVPPASSVGDLRQLADAAVSSNAQDVGEGC